MSDPGPNNNFIPDYASYDWIGAPANFTLTTNAATGGDSRMLLDIIHND